MQQRKEMIAFEATVNFKQIYRGKMGNPRNTDLCFELLIQWKEWP